MAVSIIYMGHVSLVNGSRQSQMAVSIVYMGHAGPVNGSGQSHMAVSIVYRHVHFPHGKLESSAAIN